jgi:hypothetical protein
LASGAGFPCALKAKYLDQHGYWHISRPACAGQGVLVRELDESAADNPSRRSWRPRLRFGFLLERGKLGYLLRCELELGQIEGIVVHATATLSAAGACLAIKLTT